MRGFADLREYQRIGIDFLSSLPRCNLFAGMGMGKTVTVYTALDALYLFGQASGPTLVLAPKRVAASTWPAEVRDWRHLRHIDVATIVGSERERLAAVRRDVSVYTANYEILPWLVAHFGARWPFEIVVCDESTRVKSYRGSVQTSKKGKEFVRGGGGVRARALGKVAHKVKRWINLSGTPAPNGLIDLWGQMWFIDRGERLGRTFGGFEDRWFRQVPTGDSGYTKVEPRPHAQAEIEARIADVTLSLQARDWFDLTAPIENRIMVDLPSAAAKRYEEMERELFTRVAGHDIEAFDAGSKSQKLLQLANGAVYLDPATEGGERPWREVHDAKLQALDSIVSEAAGAPVLVAYHFKSDLARLRRAFPRARVLDDKPQTIADWNAGRIPILLAHPASAGHGLNLQHGGNILVYFSVNWNAENHNQIFERIGPVRQMQSGYERPVFVHYILARGTVDETVMARLADKISVEEALMRAWTRKYGNIAIAK